MRPLGRTRLYTFVQEVDEEDLAGFGMLAGWAVILIVMLLAVFIIDPPASSDADLIRLSYSDILPSWPALHINDIAH